MKDLKEIKKLLIVASIVLLFVITLGVTYAFFTYVKDGTTENTIKSGSITFLYDEINQSGNSIGIEDALPTSDTLGKQQTNYFNFKIVSTASTTTSIPYEITLRQKTGTDNIGDKIKVYLSKIDSYNSQVSNEDEVVTSMFSDLTTVTHNNYSEKLLHNDIVPASNTRYEQYYRLKMWLDASTNLSSANYSDKTFTVMVNVYSNGHALDANSGNANISSVSVGGNALTVSSTENNIDYYETTLPEGTQQTTISVETADYTRVQVIKTQSDFQTPLATSNNINRLSQTLSKVVQLTDGANYFKIITISENGNEKETHMKIVISAPFCFLQSGTALTVGAKYECNPGDDIVRNFYILSIDNVNNTVDLLMDRNIYNRALSWNTAINYFTTGEGLAVKNSWTNVLDIGLPGAQAIADAGGIPGWDYTTAGQSDWSYFGVNSTTDPGSSIKSAYSWLYNYTRDCAAHGCDSETSLSSPDSDGYWTKDLLYSSSSRAWSVFFEGYLDNYGAAWATHYGIRPVITVNTTDLGN